MVTFGELVAQETSRSLAKQLPDYNWVQENTNWPGVELISNSLTVYGRDTLQLANFSNYLKEKLADAVLRGASVISQSDFNESINDMLGSLKYSAEVFRLVAFSSMEITAGGKLRASVAIVLARKIETDPSYVGSVVYKAIYDIKAQNDHYWNNSRGHLQRIKGWAIYKALTDFNDNSSYLLSGIYNAKIPVIKNVEYSF